MTDRCNDHDGRPDPYATKTSNHPTRPLPLKLRNRIPSPLPPKLILSLPPAPSVSLIPPTQPNPVNPQAQATKPTRSVRALNTAPPHSTPHLLPAQTIPFSSPTEIRTTNTHISDISHIPKHTRHRDDVHDRQPGRARRPAEVFVSVDVHVLRIEPSAMGIPFFRTLTDVEKGEKGTEGGLGRERGLRYRRI